MKNNTEGIKFQSASATNFKGIKHIEVQMDGRSMIISGGNGNDKSSFIQLLKSACNAKFLPDVAISEGEDKGSFEVVIAGQLNGAPIKYTIEYIFTKANQKGRIAVTDTDGKEVKQTPKDIIKQIVGDISFDVFKFINEPKSKQIEVLKKLTGKVVEIDALEVKKKELLEKHLTGKKEIEFFRKSIVHDFTEEQIKLYSKPIDEAVKTKELETISVDLDNFNKITAGVASKKELISKLSKENEDGEKTIKDLLSKIEDQKDYIIKRNETITSLNTDIKNGDKWLENKVAPSITAINDELKLIREHNKNHEKVAKLTIDTKKLLDMETSVEQINTDIKAVVAERSEIISKSKLPVAGLSFTDDDVFYNGLPFNDGQLNKAKVVIIGSQIGYALNPTAKFGFISDGSLLDQESKNEVFAWGEENGIQILMEVVREKGGPLGIEFIEKEITSI